MYTLFYEGIKSVNQHREPFTNLSKHKSNHTPILRARSNEVVEVVGRRRGGVVESLTRDSSDVLAVSDDFTSHSTWGVGDLEFGKTALDREGLSVGSGSQGDLGGTGGEDDSVEVVVCPVPSGGSTNVIGCVGIVCVRSRPHDERVLGDGWVLTSLECGSVVLSQDVQSLMIKAKGPFVGSCRETTVDRTNV